MVDDFDYAVTRAEALAALQDFMDHRLALFGDYEDALTRRSHVVYHSLLSPYLNLGLLEPLEVATAVQSKRTANRESAHQRGRRVYAPGHRLARVYVPGSTGGRCRAW